MKNFEGQLTNKGSDNGHKIVVQHETFSAKGPARVGVQNGDDNRHVSSPNSHGQSNTWLKNQVWTSLDKFKLIWTSVDHKQFQTSLDNFEQLWTSLDQFELIYSNLDQFRKSQRNLIKSM